MSITRKLAEEVAAEALGGTLLGSVGHQVLHHAACPVLIVRGEVAPVAGEVSR